MEYQTLDEIIETDKKVFYIGRTVRVNKSIKLYRLIDKNSKHLIGQYGTITGQKIGETLWKKQENNMEYRKALILKVRFENGEEAYFTKGQLDHRLAKFIREANYYEK